MYLNGYISDTEWLFLLFSDLGLVNCMDKKCHEIVYMKLWPNMDSKLWKCILLILEFIIASLLTFAVSTDSCPHHPLNLTKKAWRVPSLLVVQMLACRVMSPLITSELLFLLSSQGGYTMAYCQKEIRWRRAHTHGLVFWGSCSSNCRPPASGIARSRGHLGCACCHNFSLGCPWQWRQGKSTVQHPALSLLWPSRKEVYTCGHPEQQTWKN